MVSTSGHALGSKHIREQLHEDSDSFSDISQDSDTDLTEHSDTDAEINRYDLSDSAGNSDDGQAGVNVGDYDGGGRGGSDNNNEDDDIEDWALWDEMTMIHVRYHFMPHLVVNHLEMGKCLFSTQTFSVILVQLYSN
jgi:hypothetical protein